MISKTTIKGPNFLKYFKPLIETLKENGGAGKTSEIVDAVINKMDIPEEELEVTLASGAFKVRNSIQFARLYLVKADYMDSSQRGLWKLTEKGFHSTLDDEKVYQIFKEVQEGLTKSRELNQILVDWNFMEKNGNDWFATKKGNRFGAVQKEGKFGKFILWPEEIIVQLGLLKIRK